MGWMADLAKINAQQQGHVNPYRLAEDVGSIYGQSQQPQQEDTRQETVQGDRSMKEMFAGADPSQLSYSPQPSQIQQQLSAQQTQQRPTDPQREMALQYINSRNPALQKIGLQSLQRIGNKAIDAAGEGEEEVVRTREWKLARDMGHKPGTPEHTAKVIELGNRKPFAVERVSQNDRFMDGDGNEVKVTAGTPMEEVRKRGLYSMGETTGSDAGTLSMLKTAQTLYGDLDLIFDDDGELNTRTMFDMAGLNTRIGSGFVSDAYSFVAKTKSAKAYKAFQTGMHAITRLETGAALAPEEIGFTEDRFFPKGQDGAQIAREKIKAFKYFIDNAVTLLDKRAPSNSSAQNKQVLDDAIQEAFEKTGGKPQEKATPQGGTPQVGAPLQPHEHPTDKNGYYLTGSLKGLKEAP